MFDKTRALALMDNDEELLQEVIRLCLLHCPVWMDELRNAITDGDAYKVENVSHRIKGSFRNIAATTAGEKAQCLENIGRSKNLTNAYHAFKDLEKETAALFQALQQYGVCKQEMVH